MSDKLHADILEIKEAIINEAKRAIKKQVPKSLAVRNEIRDNLVQLAKRAIKKQVPKSLAVRNEIRDNLVQLFNTFTNTLAVHWFKLGDNQKQQYRQLFLQIRDKVIRSLL
ncbi:hypothetical protein QE152_g24753 [Popillia japonica]|uniref:Uncharacterized protein n=1 Tax=Popillia japonica TaxID=7064 RepID=A0AAW1K402_POPJA